MFEFFSKVDLALFFLSGEEGFLVSLSVCGCMINEAVSAKTDAAVHIQITCSQTSEWL